MTTQRTTPMPSVAGVTHRRIRAGDLDVHVAEAGDGPPVVLLHGAPQHWFAWRRVMALLAPEHRLIAPDLRGCGWTSAPSSGYDLGTQTGDVLAMLDALGLERVTLVAHDYSTFLGWRIAFDHSERLAGLVALGSPHPWFRPTPAMAAQLWRVWFQPVVATPALGPLLARTGRQGIVRVMLGAQPGADDAELQAFLEAVRPPERARALSAIYRRLILPSMAALARGPYDERHLSVPTRIVLAGDDPVVREAGMGPWRGTAVDLQVSTAAAAGHDIPRDRPDAVAAAVRSLTGAAG